MSGQIRRIDDRQQVLSDAKVAIPKLEAARTQLEMAIRLFFEDKDTVSIHTLASAAYTIIQDVNRSRGGQPMLVKDLIKLLVPTQKRRAVHVKLNEAENFFKHADRDPDAILVFRPSVTRFAIFDAALKYHELTGETPEGVNIFMWWLLATEPALFVLPDTVREAARRLVPTIKKIPKREFLAFFASFSSVLPDFFGPKTHEAVTEFMARVVKGTSAGRASHGP